MPSSIPYGVTSGIFFKSIKFLFIIMILTAPSYEWVPCQYGNYPTCAKGYRVTEKGGLCKCTLKSKKRVKRKRKVRRNKGYSRPSNYF